VLGLNKRLRVKREKTAKNTRRNFPTTRKDEGPEHIRTLPVYTNRKGENKQGKEENNVRGPYPKKKAIPPNALK